MKHRGTARKRVARVKLAGPGPGAWDADHGRRARGRRARLLLGTRGAGALLRLDRVYEAKAAAGRPLSAGGVTLALAE